MVGDRKRFEGLIKDVQEKSDELRTQVGFPGWVIERGKATGGIDHAITIGDTARRWWSTADSCLMVLCVEFWRWGWLVAFHGIAWRGVGYQNSILAQTLLITAGIHQRSLRRICGKCPRLLYGCNTLLEAEWHC